MTIKHYEYLSELHTSQVYLKKNKLENQYKTQDKACQEIIQSLNEPSTLKCACAQEILSYTKQVQKESYYVEHGPYKSHRDLGCQESRYTADETYTSYGVGPALECLFEPNNRDLFKKILDAVSESNEEIQKTFLNIIQNSDLNNQGLFTWDTAYIMNLKKELRKLEQYEKDNKNSTNLKTEHISFLKVKLGTYLKSPLSSTTKDHPEELLAILKLKLDLLEEIHSKDELFAKHRGWKQIMMNLIASILCPPLGAINGIYYLAKGHGLFQSQTRTQGYVNDIHKAVGFNPELAPSKGLK